MSVNTLLPKLDKKFKHPSVFIDKDSCQNSERRLRASLDPNIMANMQHSFQQKADELKLLQNDVQELKNVVNQQLEDIKSKEMFIMHLKTSNQKLLNSKNLKNQDQQLLLENQEQIESLTQNLSKMQNQVQTLNENKKNLEKTILQKDTIINQQLKIIQDHEIEIKKRDEDNELLQISIQKYQEQLLEMEQKKSDNVDQNDIIEQKLREQAELLKQDADIIRKTAQKEKEEALAQINDQDITIQNLQQKIQDFNTKKVASDKFLEQLKKDHEILLKDLQTSNYKQNSLSKDKEALEETIQESQDALKKIKQELEQIQKSQKNNETKNEKAIQELKNIHIKEKYELIDKQKEHLDSISQLNKKIETFESKQINDKLLLQLQEQNTSLQNNIQKLKTEKLSFSSIESQINELEKQDQQITNQIKCGACKQGLTAPITVIPCGHSFCLKCRGAYDKGFCGQCGPKGKVDLQFRLTVSTEMNQWTILFK